MTDWAFITSAGPAIGLGHAARTALLAREAVASGDSARVYVPVGDVPAPLQGSPADVVPLPFAADELGHELVSAGWNPITVLDLPDGELAELDWLREVSTFRVAFRMFGPTAGEHPIEHVNLSPSFSPPTETLLTEHGSRTLCLTGWNLILIRPSLFARPDDKRPDKRLVVVTMGGSDPYGLTELACSDLATHPVEASVVVVIGAQNDRGRQLRTRYGARFEIVDQYETDFDALLKTATVAVINGGLTRYECLAARTPFVAISIHDKQHALTEYVTRHGFGTNLGVHDRLGSGAVSEAVARNLMSTTTGSDSPSPAVEHIDVHAPRRLLERCRELRRTGIL